MNEIGTLIINTVKNITISSILDILVVSFIFYKGYMLIKETRAEQLLKGTVFIFALIPISLFLRLDTLNFILNKTLTIGVLAMIIIFQPEIRRVLEHLGRSTFEDIHYGQPIEYRNEVVNEIVTAVENLAATKTGALIAIEQGTGLGEIISSGTVIDAQVSANLPLTNNNSINKKLGTRHRAAMGLSENSDALVIVVSEETGVISLAVNGRLTRNYDKEKLKTILLKIMENRDAKRVKSAGEKVKTWIKGMKKEA